ncbi:MAG: PIN domain-containing protein [Candidatus Micrarchaeota archaeon]|nr:PIN domain-containing protein [Candidatus Micrarchaeota archaeon]MDE1848185.1 PIN domain-containing protein [Candidatus Micrarchaeota archaeon]MDE1864666.1 PIN domain-containing protein [Candidatus Micrarchaeota archaeon]
MIVDTTYLLRLSSVETSTNLLGAIDEGKTSITFDELGVSLISLFELQAKIAKLRLPPKLATKAIEVITSEFRVEPFYNKGIVEKADLLSRRLNDYIDCIILATAIVLKEDLITEDSKIKKQRKSIEKEYGIRILDYKEVLNLKSG